MKNHKLKGYMAMLLLCLSATLLFNCQKEDDATTQSQSSFKTLDKNLQITRLYEADINKNSQLLRGIDVVENKMKEGIANRDIYNATYDFTINTTYAKVINDGTTRTYTFGVYRDEDNGLLENLFMVEKDDGTFDVSLVQYDLTPLEIEALNNREIVDVEGKIAFVALDDISGDVLGKYYYNGNCYENYYVYQSGNSCASGNHNWEDGDACDYWGDVNQMATSGGYVLTPTIVPCDDSTGGGSSDTGGSPNGDNPNNTNPNGGSGSGPSDSNGSTSPVTCTRDCIGDVDECPQPSTEILAELESTFGSGNFEVECNFSGDFPEALTFDTLEELQAFRESFNNIEVTLTEDEPVNSQNEKLVRFIFNSYLLEFHVVINQQLGVDYVNFSDYSVLSVNAGVNSIISLGGSWVHFEKLPHSTNVNGYESTVEFYANASIGVKYKDWLVGSSGQMHFQAVMNATDGSKIRGSMNGE